VPEVETELWDGKSGYEWMQTAARLFTELERHNGHTEGLVADKRELQRALQAHHANVWASCAVCGSVVGVQSAQMNQRSER
jgi:hypothetical protein